MSAGRGNVTLSEQGVVTGNTYDKYGSQSTIVQRLMARFNADVDALLLKAAPGSLLDVGCGEGVQLQRWAQLLPDARLTGIDLQEDSLQAAWQAHRAPNLEYLIGSAEALPCPDGNFDLVSAIEVLEHVPDPRRTLAEMARCARAHLLISVPREPLWRALNVARGAYLAQLGNTPGHINHFSRRRIVALGAEFGKVIEVRTPPPWTALLVQL